MTRANRERDAPVAPKRSESRVRSVQCHLGYIATTTNIRHWLRVTLNPLGTFTIEHSDRLLDRRLTTDELTAIEETLAEARAWAKEEER